MKKRVLSLLLVVAMLASLVVFPTYATGSSEEWTPLTATTELVNGGQYILNEDVVRDTLVVDGINVTIDLNGHVLRATHGQRLLVVKGVANVTIKDTSIAQTGEMQATGTSMVKDGDTVIDDGRGGVIRLDAQGSETNADTPLTLNIEGGTIRQLYAADVSVQMGGGIELETTVGSNPEAITVNMTGGKITDGYVSNRGGNVCISGGGKSVFNMDGGEIVNGYATKGGGFYLASGTLNMTGGKFTNNIAASGNGGNIYNAATLNISDDAVVSGGVASGFGGNIFNGGTATLNGVIGGVTEAGVPYGVTGDIYTENNNVTLIGDVNIPMGNSNGLLLKSGATLDLSKLDLDAMKANEHYIYFGVNVTNGKTAVFTANGGATYKDVLRNVGCITSVTEDENKELVAGRAANGIAKETVLESWCPHCGEYVEWKRVGLWATYHATVSHYYNYNVQNITVGGSKYSKNFVVDMAGAAITNHKKNVTDGVVTKADSALITVGGAGANISILDTIGGGKFTSKPVTTDGTTPSVNGAIVNSTVDTTITIYSGTMTGVSLRGGVVRLDKGTLNMKGGIIKDSKCTYSPSNGGAIWAGNGADATVNISGGLISNCTNEASNAGSIAFGRGTFNMTGGIIQGGTASTNGGNITLSGTGTYTISNAIIRGGSQTSTAQHGGNININGASNVTISNSTICAGTATGNGGNIAATAAANITINNSAIYDGGAVDGGNIYSIGAVTLNNVTLANGTATGNGGNIAVNAAVALNASNAHFAGGSAKNGGSVYSLGAVELDKVSVVGGNASTNGGNIYAENNITVKNNSTIDGGTAVSGGSIYATGNITLTDSTVRGGTASTYGGNIYMGGGNTLDIDNSVVADGTATGTATEETTEEKPTNTGYGGNIYSNHGSAKLLMDNTEVSNGYAAIGGTDKGRGGNIYFNNGSLVLNTCTFNGGSAYYGGSIYTAANADLDNVTITGGNATKDGGGFYHNGAKKDVSLDNVTVTDCVAGTNGGNVRFRAAANVTSFKDVTLTNGKAGLKGGNLSIETPLQYIHVENLEATGGQAEEYGGNIYVESAAAFDMTGGTVSAGTAGKDGGNLYIADSVTDESVVLTNVSFLNGKAYANTAERHESSDNIYAATDIVLDGVQVSGNSGQNELGSGVYATAKVTLKNDTEVGSENDPISGSLYLKNATSSLEVDSSFSGFAVLSPYWLFVDVETNAETGETKTTSKMAGGGFEPFGQILDIATTTDNFDGKLYLGDHKTSKLKYWVFGMPAITRNAEGKLVVDEGGAVVKTETGAKHYIDIDAAVEAYKNDTSDKKVLKLVATEPKVALTGGDYYIDFNGKNADVSGTGTVYGIDTTNDAHEVYGTLTVAEGVTVAAEKADVVVRDPLTGETYIKLVEEDGKYSFHHISMDISKVVLRTSNAGVYYKGEWVCDNTLTDYLSSQGDAVQYGVVASAGETGMPEDGFDDKDGFRWSYYSGANLKEEGGKVATGAVVTGILKPDKESITNAENFDTEIHAKAYLMLTDAKGAKSYIVGNTGATKSMMDMFVTIDKALSKTNSDVTSSGDIKTLMDDFYGDWSEAIELAKGKEGAHVFKNIFQTPAPTPAPEQSASV